jgi:hypothetical protein
MQISLSLNIVLDVSPVNSQHLCYFPTTHQKVKGCKGAYNVFGQCPLACPMTY